MREQAQKVLEALGGPENLVDIEGCLTRLRGTVVDPGKIDIGKLKQLQIKGEPIVRGNTIQIVLGTYSEMIGTEINKLMKAR